MLTVIFLFLGGALAASSVIIAKKPNAKELIDKIVPFQGWLGIVLLIWGIFDVISLLGLISWFSYFPVLFIVLVVCVAAELGLGFLLGFGLISKYALSKNEAAMEKGQKIRAKLTKIQIPLGFVGMIIAILYLVLRFTYL